ncbi:zinc finger CCCH domain-containing protein 24 [Scenedesmus sp. PABB004]|nr:zinc finger CCCH domain-containing protein 24 [Scenedesmus sp. PABB004]
MQALRAPSGASMRAGLRGGSGAPPPAAAAALASRLRAAAGCPRPDAGPRSVAPAGGGGGRRRRAAPAARAAAAPAPAAAAVADPALALAGAPGRAVGALVGSMAGNALGAQVEPEKPYRLARLFPDGLGDMAWTFDLAAAPPGPLPPGHVTGDWVAMLAVAWGLARARAADALEIADCLASSYSPGGAQRCSPYTELALDALAGGANPFTLAHRAEALLATTPSRASQSCSHRPDRQRHGPEDFTAALRGVPVGIAYAGAPRDALAAAVDAAVAFTHPSDEGGAGALAVAAAVAWLLRADAATATPEQLLDHVADVCAGSPSMAAKLELLRARLPALAGLGEVTDWRAFWAGPDWAQLVGTANRLTKSGLAVTGSQAAALALAVVVASWRHPRQAVMLAASLGGFAATTAGLVGALAGALHGCDWLPADWWAQLVGDDDAAAARGAGAGAGAAPTGGEEQQQQGGGAGAAEAAAAQQLEEGGPWATLRVSKHTVVALGQELAGLGCKAAPTLLAFAGAYDTCEEPARLAGGRSAAATAGRAAAVATMAALLRKINLLEVLREEAEEAGRPLPPEPSEEELERWTEEQLRQHYAPSDLAALAARWPAPDVRAAAAAFPGLPRTACARPAAVVIAFHCAGCAEDMWTSEGTGARRAPSPLLELARARRWQLLAPQLPGRALRAREAPLPTLQAVARELLPLVAPALAAAGAWAVCGHSMGAWAAWELLLLLRAEGAQPARAQARRAAAAACAGGRGQNKLGGRAPSRAPCAPRRPPPGRHRAGFPEPAVACLSAMPWPGIPEAARPWRRQAALDEAQFKEECRGWDVRDAVFAPAQWAVYGAQLRADFRLFDEYAPSPDPPRAFTFPLRLFWGAADRRVTRAMVEAWGGCTHGPVTASEVAGHHLWPLQPAAKAAWLRELAAALAAALPTPASLTGCGTAASLLPGAGSASDACDTGLRAPCAPAMEPGRSRDDGTGGPHHQRVPQAVYQSAEFIMYAHKILPCSKRYSHEWTTCPFAHPGEKAKRRDPRTHRYDCHMCPAIVKGEACELGASCPHSHHVFESWLHPMKFRTMLCKDGDDCHREVCFFAHGAEQLRMPSRDVPAAFGGPSRLRRDSGLPSEGQPAFVQPAYLASPQAGGGVRTVWLQLPQHPAAAVACSPSGPGWRATGGTVAAWPAPGCAQEGDSRRSSACESTTSSMLMVPAATFQQHAQAPAMPAMPSTDWGAAMQLPAAPAAAPLADADASAGLAAPRGSGLAGMSALLESLVREVQSSRADAASSRQVAAQAQQQLRALTTALGPSPGARAALQNQAGAAAAAAAGAAAAGGEPLPAQLHAVGSPLQRQVSNDQAALLAQLQQLQQLQGALSARGSPQQPLAHAVSNGSTMSCSGSWALAAPSSGLPTLSLAGAAAGGSGSFQVLSGTGPPGGEWVLLPGGGGGGDSGAGSPPTHATWPLGCSAPMLTGGASATAAGAGQLPSDYLLALQPLPASAPGALDSAQVAQLLQLQQLHAASGALGGLGGGGGGEEALSSCDNNTMESLTSPAGVGAQAQAGAGGGHQLGWLPPAPARAEHPQQQQSAAMLVAATRPAVAQARPVVAGRVRQVPKPKGRRALLLGTGLVLLSSGSAQAKDFKEALAAKEARRAKLRGTAGDMKTSGKDQQVFKSSDFMVSEEARTPNIHSRQEEGAKTQQNVSCAIATAAASASARAVATASACQAAAPAPAALQAGGRARRARDALLQLQEQLRLGVLLRGGVPVRGRRHGGGAQRVVRLPAPVRPQAHYRGGSWRSGGSSASSFWLDTVDATAGAAPPTRGGSGEQPQASGGQGPATPPADDGGGGEPRAPRLAAIVEETSSCVSSPTAPASHASSGGGRMCAAGSAARHAGRVVGSQPTAAFLQAENPVDSWVATQATLQPAWAQHAQPPAGRGRAARSAPGSRSGAGSDSGSGSGAGSDSGSGSGRSGSGGSAEGQGPLAAAQLLLWSAAPGQGRTASASPRGAAAPEPDHHALLAVLNPLEAVLWQQRLHQRALLERALHALTSLQTDVDALLAAAARPAQQSTAPEEQPEQGLEQAQSAAPPPCGWGRRASAPGGASPDGRAALIKAEPGTDVAGGWAIKAHRSSDARPLPPAGLEPGSRAAVRDDAPGSTCGSLDFESELLSLEQAAPGRRLSAEALRACCEEAGLDAQVEQPGRGSGSSVGGGSVCQLPERTAGDSIEWQLRALEGATRPAEQQPQAASDEPGGGGDGGDEDGSGFEALVLAAEAAEPGRRLSDAATAEAAAAAANAAGAGGPELAGEAGDGAEQPPQEGAAPASQRAVTFQVPARPAGGPAGGAGPDAGAAARPGPWLSRGAVPAVADGNPVGEPPALQGEPASMRVEAPAGSAIVLRRPGGLVATAGSTAEESPAGRPQLQQHPVAAAEASLTASPGSIAGSIAGSIGGSSSSSSGDFEALMRANEVAARAAAGHAGAAQEDRWWEEAPDARDEPETHPAAEPGPALHAEPALPAQAPAEAASQRAPDAGGEPSNSSSSEDGGSWLLGRERSAELDFECPGSVGGAVGLPLSPRSAAKTGILEFAWMAARAPPAAEAPAAAAQATQAAPQPGAEAEPRQTLQPPLTLPPQPAQLADEPVQQPRPPQPAVKAPMAGAELAGELLLPQAAEAGPTSQAPLPAPQPDAPELAAAESAKQVEAAAVAPPPAQGCAPGEPTDAGVAGPDAGGGGTAVPACVTPPAAEQAALAQAPALVQAQPSAPESAVPAVPAPCPGAGEPLAATAPAEELQHAPRGHSGTGALAQLAAATAAAVGCAALAGASTADSPVQATALQDSPPLPGADGSDPQGPEALEQRLGGQPTSAARAAAGQGAAAPAPAPAAPRAQQPAASPCTASPPAAGASFAESSYLSLPGVASGCSSITLELALADGGSEAGAAPAHLPPQRQQPALEPEAQQPGAAGFGAASAVTAQLPWPLPPPEPPEQSEPLPEQPRRQTHEQPEQLPQPLPPRHQPEQPPQLVPPAAQHATWSLAGGQTGGTATGACCGGCLCHCCRGCAAPPAVPGRSVRRRQPRGSCSTTSGYSSSSSSSDTGSAGAPPSPPALQPPPPLPATAATAPWRAPRRWPRSPSPSSLDEQLRGIDAALQQLERAAHLERGREQALHSALAAERRRWQRWRRQEQQQWQAEAAEDAVEAADAVASAWDARAQALPSGAHPRSRWAAAVGVDWPWPGSAAAGAASGGAAAAAWPRCRGEPGGWAVLPPATPNACAPGARLGAACCGGGVWGDVARECQAELLDQAALLGEAAAAAAEARVAAAALCGGWGGGGW